MDDDDDQMVLDNIDETVNDEGKIVSYKWLSLSLSLNVNKATRLLEEYINKTENELDVIYFVGGRKKDENHSSFSYKLAKQNNLDEVKCTFDEVTTCHIYSIQKSCIKDTGVLYTNHLDIINEHLSQINKCSAIQCDSVKNLGETLAQRTQHREVPVTNGFHELNEVEENTKPQQPTSEHKHQTKPNQSKTSKNTSNKKGTAPKSFFGKASSKKQDDATVLVEDSSPKKQEKTTVAETSEDKIIEVKESSKSKSKGENNDISAAFSKTKKKPDPSKEVLDKKSLSPKPEKKTEDWQRDEEKENCVKEEPVTKQKKKEKSVVVSPVKEDTNVDKSKKRKAPVIDSESDDDDFEKFLTKSKDPTYKSPEKKQDKPKVKTPVKDDDDEVDVIEPTPEPAKKKKKRKTEKVKEKNLPTEKPEVKQKQDVGENKKTEESNSTGGKRRGRRMVMKSKQFLDEDGFMVTRKECESESFSEESDSEMTEEKFNTLSPEKKKVVEQKKVVVDLEKKTKAHLSKPKTQASLMNFFKKK